MKHLFKYKVKLNNDAGTIILTVVAHSYQNAKNIVVIAEKCPETAIKEVKQIEQIY